MLVSLLPEPDSKVNFSLNASDLTSPTSIDEKRRDDANDATTRRRERESTLSFIIGYRDLIWGHQLPRGHFEMPKSHNFDKDVYDL